MNPNKILFMKQLNSKYHLNCNPVNFKIYLIED